MLCLVAFLQLKCNIQRLLMTLLFVPLKKTSKIKEKLLQDKTKISDELPRKIMNGNLFFLL